MTWEDINDLLTKDPRVKPVAEEMMGSMLAGGISFEVAYNSLRSILVVLRHYNLHGTLAETTDALDEELADTDIADDMPCTLLRLPFPEMFLQFSKTGAKLLPMSDPTTGKDLHADGIYLQEEVLPVSIVSRGLVPPEYRDRRYPEGATFRRITMMLCAADPEEPDDDSNLNSIMYIFPEDEDRPLLEVFRATVEKHQTFGREAAINALAHTAKVLLYMNLPDARRVDVKERTELEKALGRAKSGKKGAKLERRLSRAYDRIVVGPDHIHAPEGAHAAGSDPRKIHWRRGHFRAQHHGTGNLLLRTVWIRRTLIGAARLKDAPPEPMPYVVKTRNQKP